MNTTKTLMLAALTALSLGAGTAMAQSEVPSAPEATYFSGQRQVAPATINTWSDQVQSGASDVEPARIGAGNQAPPLPAYDYGTLANPG
jgi:hypothetical protein